MKIVIKMTKEVSGTYRAWVPSLPGCFARGQTHTEAWQKIEQAIRGYLSSMNVAIPDQIRKHVMTA
jgi:predicted RNase H-like HicB family nuclease